MSACLEVARWCFFVTLVIGAAGIIAGVCERLERMGYQQEYDE